MTVLREHKMPDQPEFQEQLLTKIMEAAQDAIVLMDDQGKIIGWNKAAERIFGYPREQVMGRDLHALLCKPMERNHFLAAFPLFRKTGTGPAVGKTVEMQALSNNGNLVPVELSLSSFCVENQWHSMGIVRDITERKAFEETLMAAKEEAERANTVRSAFIANISHELRTPLHGLIGMQSLLDRTSLDTEQQECLSFMKEASAKLLHLVEDLLDINKLDKGIKLLNEETFYYGQTLMEAMKPFEKMAASKGLSWDCKLRNLHKVKVSGDREKLIRSACHLITNAIKFTPKGGIGLSMDLKNVYQDIGIFTFMVKDTGIGIDQKIQPYLFEKFYQRDALTNRLNEGAGVGLPLAKRFIEIMGGNIHFRSEPEIGSEFTLELPLRIIEMAPEIMKHFAEADYQAKGETLFDSLRVLVAEDDRSTRVLMKKLLKTLGVEVDLAENGLEAFNQYTNRDYDLVLLDIQMPVMDGFETAQMMREYEKEFGQRTPVIALTAYSSEHDRHRCMKYGMDDVLTKPVDLNSTYEMIHKWTHHR